ncbi:MAG TPA: YdcF family protein [Actinokineospora sp.]|nr:YdcF family protein [Actinokineospora sp.]
MRNVPVQPRPILRAVRRLSVGFVLMSLLVIGGTAFRVWQVGRIDDRDQADVVVVLGAAQYAGKPSKVLEARLRKAKSLYDEGVAKYVVTGGGRREGDRFTEAEAGRTWLVNQGVPRDRVIDVGEGNDTLGTLRAVATEVKRRGWESAVIVSDPWHSLRARTMAHDAGLDAWTSPTHSGPIVQTRQTQARYIFRETAALLYYRATNASADGIALDGEVG